MATEARPLAEDADPTAMEFSADEFAENPSASAWMPIALELRPSAVALMLVAVAPQPMAVAPAAAAGLTPQPTGLVSWPLPIASCAQAGVANDPASAASDMPTESPPARPSIAGSRVAGAIAPTVAAPTAPPVPRAPSPSRSRFRPSARCAWRSTAIRRRRRERLGWSAPATQLVAKWEAGRRTGRSTGNLLPLTTSPLTEWSLRNTDGADAPVRGAGNGNVGLSDIEPVADPAGPQSSASAWGRSCDCVIPLPLAEPANPGRGCRSARPSGSPGRP